MRAGDGADYRDFISAYGVITKDSVAGPTGSPLILRSWQGRLLDATFARDPVTGRRLVRTAVWIMGRKNGKTGLVAPVAAKGLMLEGQGAEVYSCAADREQAKLVFGATRRNVELVPELASRLRLYRDAIEDPVTGSVYRALSSEAFTKEGLSPTLVIYDELHAAPNRELYDVMALAMGTRIDPLMIVVTTPGVRTDTTGQDSIAYQLYQYGLRVAAREIVDPTFFMAAWQAPEGCALDDEGAWRAANPGYGDILDPNELAGQARRAMTGGMSEAEFRIKRLAQWYSSARTWLPAGAFEGRAVERSLRPKEPLVLGFDGSFNHDCTALVAATLDGFLDVIDCWERPADQRSWQVPVAEVEARVMDTVKRYDVREIGADPFRWARELQGWEAAGLPVVEYPTTSPSRMVPACAKFYDAIMDGRLSHSGDPRLIRHVNNAVLKTDHLGPRIVKEHRGSPRSIDLAVAAVVAYDRATFHAGQPPTQRLGALLV